MRQLGFSGPYTGTGKHPEFMVRGDVQLQLPNEHRGDIRVGLLGQLLKEAGVARQEWVNAR